MNVFVFAALVLTGSVIVRVIHRRRTNARLKHWRDAVSAEIERAGGFEAWKRQKAEERQPSEER